MLLPSARGFGIAAGVGVGIAASVACSRASTVASMFDVGARVGVGVGASVGPHAATDSVISPNTPITVRMTTTIIAFQAGNRPHE